MRPLEGRRDLARRDRRRGAVGATRCSRTPGVRRSAAGTGTRRRTSGPVRDGGDRGAGLAGARGARTDGRSFVSSAYPGVAGRPRAELLAELVAARAVDRRRRRAREDDDRGDDRVRPARDRPRPELDRRRRGARSSARTPARGRAGSSSRATSPTARSRRCVPRVAVVTERRPRPPLRVRLAGRGRGALRGVAREGARGRARVGARARSTSSWRCRASTIAGTPRLRWPRSSSRGAAGGGGRCARGVPGRRPPVRARRRGAAGCEVFDDYAHNPREAAGGARDRAERAGAAGACSSLFQPHLYSRTLHLATRARPGARRRRRRRRRRTIYPAREQPVGASPGSSSSTRSATRGRGSRRAGRRGSRTARDSCPAVRGPATSC